MSTTYLKFTDEQTAIAALTAAGYTMDEYNAHCQGDGWGTVFATPDTDGHFCNLYDCNNLPETLQQYVVPAPLTPYNCRAGEIVETVYRCVVVADAIRDNCRAMVVQLAGPTHADMWSTRLVRESDGAVFWINYGPVRLDLAAMLDDASLLAVCTGITLEQAQYILSQCDVSEDQPEAAMDRLKLTLHSWSE